MAGRRWRGKRTTEAHRAAVIVVHNGWMTAIAAAVYITRHVQDEALQAKASPIGRVPHMRSSQTHPCPLL